MVSSLEWFRSNSSALKISVTLRLTVTSSSSVRFLMSCWVMVEPPWMSCPVNMYRMAAAVRFQSTPWCSRKRLSSMAMVALTRYSGISS